MIIWKGWGILALLIPAVFVGGGDAVLEQIMAAAYNAPVVQSLLLLASAAAVWVAGRKLNNAPVRHLIDSETGEIADIKPAHSLFWIPMQWFAVLWALVPVVLFIKNSGLL